MKLIYKKCTTKACSMFGLLQIYQDKNRDTCPFCGEHIYQVHDKEKIDKVSYRYETDEFILDNTHPDTLGNKINEQIGFSMQENCDNLKIDNSVELSDKEKSV